MIEIQTTKTVILLRPQLKNNGAFANNTYVDWHAWNHCRFLFIVGDTDIAVGSGDASTAPLIEECNTTGGTYTAVTGAQLSAVIGATDDNKNFAIDIDLRKTLKRYARVKAPTAGNGSTGANLTILAILSKGQIGPKDAAGQGLSELVYA
jgi:hypothetical protein